MAEEAKTDGSMRLYYQTPDERAKLYLGDARYLDLIPDESIDMIATSVPYWGKRDYGEEVVTIWGGEERHEHEWGGQLGDVVAPQRRIPHGDGRSIETDPYAQRRIEVPTTRLDSGGQYCSLCGAWRGALGLEPTWQEYIAHLCECAEEWWRVLKPTGNLFVNIGDTFFGGSSGQNFDSDAGSTAGGSRPGGGIEGGAGFGHIARRDKGGIPKMKLGIPYRLRFALNDMGWVSRADNVWYKGKEYEDDTITKVAMPESARREACSYEMVFRFTKTHKMNYYVHERTGECRKRPPSPQVADVDFQWLPHTRCEGKGCSMKICHDGMVKSTFWHGYTEWFDLDAVRRPHAQPERSGKLESRKPHKDLAPDHGMMRWVPERREYNPAGANPGDVWIIQPEPFREAHYAVWPSELCERMIKVGCPKEVCPKCGKPRERITRERSLERYELSPDDPRYRPARYDHKYPGQGMRYHESNTIGWSDCGCGEGFVPGVVLDPFCGGSGRIAERALYLGRDIIGVDLKEGYLEMAKKPLMQGVLL